MNKAEIKNVFFRIFRTIKNIVLFLSITIVLAIALYYAITSIDNYYSKKDYENKKQEYLNLLTMDTDALFEISNVEGLIFNPETYRMFENACLGNSSSNLLSNGSYCRKNSIVCKSINNTILIVNDTETIISEEPSSFINIIGDNVYFRNDVTRALYKYTISTGNIECIVSENCGEVVVSTKGISYIDFSTLHLMYIPFDTMKIETVSELSIQSFAVVGTDYLCLTVEKDLGILSSQIFNKLDSNVDRFFYNGTIAIQKGDTIYVLKDGKEIENTIQNVDGILVNFNGENLFVRSNSAIDIYDLNTDNNSQILTNVAEEDAVKSFCTFDDSYEIIVYNKTDTLYSAAHQTILKKR